MRTGARSSRFGFGTTANRICPFDYNFSRLYCKSALFSDFCAMMGLREGIGFWELTQE
jgi:hypothetical protein